MRCPLRGGGRRAVATVAVMLLSAPPAGWAAESPSVALVRPGSPWLPPADEAAAADSAASESPPAGTSTSPRATKTGMWIGAVTGAVVGAGLLVLAMAFSEYETSNEYDAGNYILAGLGGAAVFGLAGAGIGALIGSAFPGKNPASEPASPAPPTREPRRSPPDTHLGSMALTTGVDALAGTENTVGSSAGMVVEGTLLANFFEGRLSVGVESGYSWVANGLFNLGGVAQIQLTDQGLRPYGVFAMGWDNWSAAPYPPPADAYGGGGVSLLRAGVGAGLRLRLGSGRTAIQLESRYNWPIQRFDEPGDYSYVSVSLGPRFSW